MEDNKGAPAEENILNLFGEGDTENLDGKLNGFDLFGNPIERKASGPIAERFVIPPFTVLDARQGDWKERKRAWLSLGIRSEIGRGDDATPTEDSGDEDGEKKPRYLASTYKNLGSWTKEITGSSRGEESGISVFDPTLCECVYRWFSAPGSQVVDPFAGGSVRGVVAGMLGRNYWGCDLRQEQVEANNVQAEEIIGQPHGEVLRPQWVCGDSTVKLAESPEADLIFSCPPYGDLERYSDDPSDLSTMGWDDFKGAYAKIIKNAVDRLKPNRFACFVVGDFRDKRGYYQDFVSSTIQAFREAGADFYNDAILVTPGGTAPLRATRQFDGGRKLVKTHQNILVFCKGDWKKAAEAAKG